MVALGRFLVTEVKKGKDTAKTPCFHDFCVSGVLLNFNFAECRNQEIVHPYDNILNWLKNFV